HGTCPIVVFRHHIGVFVEHFDDAGHFGPLEVVTPQLRLVIFGRLGLFSNLDLRTARSGRNNPKFDGPGPCGLRLSFFDRFRSSLPDSVSPSLVEVSEEDSGWRFLSSLFAIFSCCFSFRCCSLRRFWKVCGPRPDMKRPPNGDASSSLPCAALFPL